jgi:hypothetical protein
MLVESVATIHYLIDAVQGSLKKRMPVITILGTFLNICPNSLFDERAIGIIEKYHYCKKWGIVPFESYEKTPKWWIVSEKIIEDEIGLLMEQVKGDKKHGGKK